VLLAEAREIDNNELDDTYGLRLTGKPKERLNDRKLVASRPVKGSLLAHRLTREGRAECDDAMAGPLARGGGAKVAALSAILLGLARHLKDADKSSLADLFRADDEPPPPAPPLSGTANIEAALREAYRRAAGRAGDWVQLDKIRADLRHIPTPELDRTLKQLARAKRIHLAPNDYQSSLSPAERKAAIKIGGRENHLIMIEG